jgi:hypothetical protein
MRLNGFATRDLIPFARCSPSDRPEEVPLMSSLAISGIVFACVFGGAILGMLLRAILPEKHLSGESKDLVKLGMGLVGTMTALVLGLLIASAKSSFDAQRNGLAQMSANVIFLDRTLAHYGPEAGAVREMLHASLDDMLQKTWPEENPEAGPRQARSQTEGRYEGIYEKIQALKPRTEAQRAWQTQALKTATDIGQERWLLFAEKGGSIPTPFLVVMVAWLALILASFSLFAPPNTTVLSTLLICALAASSAIFLILELDRPFDGLIRISSSPVREARRILDDKSLPTEEGRPSHFRPTNE